MSNQLESLICEMARDIEARSDAAHDLWTWLPSHHFYVKAFGDYAGEYRPNEADIMREAAMVLSICNRESHEMGGYQAREWFHVSAESMGVVNRTPIKDEVANAQIVAWFKDRWGVELKLV